MAFVETRTRFPSFRRSKDFFKSGLGGPPEVQITGGAGGAEVPLPGVTSPALGATQPITPPPADPPSTAPVTGTPTAPPPPAGDTLAPTVEPIELGYQTTGGIEERLFQPIGAATEAGEAQLTEFADLFRTQAGPSRTFESINAPATLEGAIQGAPIAPAQELLASQYQGPAGLDPGAAGNLMGLAGRLRARQEALGTGGGLSETLAQSAPGTTGGEARFTAQDVLGPDYRGRLAAATAGVDPFAGRLEEEITGTAEFAQQRTGEEEAIATQAEDYLRGRKTGITGDIEAEMEKQLGLQGQAGDLFREAMKEGQTPEQIADILREAQSLGFIDPEADVGAFNTEIRQAISANPAIAQELMNRPEFESLAEVPLAELGIDNKGRQTYMIPDANGNLKDFRTVLGTGQEAVLFKQRQAAFEEAFSSQRGVPFASGKRTSTTGGQFGEPSLSQLADPLYFGKGIESSLPQITNFLDLDSGVRPSRGNVSTEEQRDQYNRIGDILQDLDRIEKDETPFRAATIAARVDEFLTAEEEALEEQKDTLDKQGKQWFHQVKTLRKRYRKAEREAKWGKIGGAVGSVLLSPLGPGISTAAGTSVGERLA
jgi:hypothetical protein